MSQSTDTVPGGMDADRLHALLSEIERALGEEVAFAVLIRQPTGEVSAIGNCDLTGIHLLCRHVLYNEVERWQEFPMPPRGCS